MRVSQKIVFCKILVFKVNAPVMGHAPIMSHPLKCGEVKGLLLPRAVEGIRSFTKYFLLGSFSTGIQFIPLLCVQVIGLFCSRDEYLPLF